MTSTNESKSLFHKLNAAHQELAEVENKLDAIDYSTMSREEVEKLNDQCNKISNKITHIGALLEQNGRAV